MRVVAKAERPRESSLLKKFRWNKPPRPRSDGRRPPDAWRRFPLNRRFSKTLSEDEIREELGNPKRGVDPYERLQFFTKEDLEPSLEGGTPQTAMPVDDPHVVRAVHAQEHVVKTVERSGIAQLKEMLKRKEISKSDIADMKRSYDAAMKDPETVVFMDKALHGDEDFFAIYPDPKEAASIDRSSMSFIDQLTLDYNIPGYVQFENCILQEDFKIPIVRLSHCNGEEVIIDLHGGCIMSWTDQRGRDRLFRHPKAVFDNRMAVEGTGIGIVFPTFGIMGALPEDGFAKSMLWDVVHSEVSAEWLPDPAPSVTLHCQDTEATRALWPHHFEIFYKITLGETDEFGDIGVSSKEQRSFDKQLRKAGSLKRFMELLEEKQNESEDVIEIKERWPITHEDNLTLVDTPDPIKDPIPTQLRLQITVCNTGNVGCYELSHQRCLGDRPMEFALAFKTHLNIHGPKQNSDYIRILGLGGRYYLDYKLVPGSPVLRLWDKDYLKLRDRKSGWNAIFTENTMNDVFFCPGHLAYFESINRRGFPDILLHQPGMMEAEESALADQLTMLGRGRVTVPAIVQPGEKWEGEVVLRHHDGFYEEPVFGYDGGKPPPDVSMIDLMPEDIPTIIDER